MDIPSSVLVEALSSNTLFVCDEESRCDLFLDYYRRVENSWIEEARAAGETEENLPPEAEEELEYIRNKLAAGVYFFNIRRSILSSLETKHDTRGKAIIDNTYLHEALRLKQKLKSIISKSFNPELGNNISSLVRQQCLYQLPCEFTEEHSFRWTEVPPYRFSKQFDNISSMKPGRRHYGKIFPYAGSHWVIYVIRKNEYLQVFLHRPDVKNEFASKVNWGDNKLSTTVKEGLKTEIGEKNYGSNGTAIDPTDNYDPRSSIKAAFEIFVHSPFNTYLSCPCIEFNGCNSWGYNLIQISLK